MEADRLYLVALSGGADSVALLLCLKDLGYRVEAVHCNFRLRGEESDRDEDFCKRLCEKENVLLHITHYDTRSYASLHGISIEMAQGICATAISSSSERTWGRQASA